MQKGLLESLTQAKVYDLGQPFFVGMPRRLTHPPYTFSLVRGHNDVTGRDFTSAFSLFAMGDHTGTHLDARCHVGEDGKVFGHDESVLDNESYGTGVQVGGIEETPPIIRRGILMDIPLVQGVEALGADHQIVAEDFAAAEEKQGITVKEGDVVLVRTGWARYFDSDPTKFNGPVEPGVVVSGAQWLIDRRISYAGADTTGFEKVEVTALMVHRMMLARNGIQIMENMNLEELARDKVYEFVFVTLPLRMVGATGSPIRPIALV